MDMQEVELVIVDDIDHGAGQGGFVGGIVEKGIGGDANFVIEDISVELVEAYGLLIGNKMHLMTFIGQGLSELGGENATSAEGGVTDDAYTHS